MNNVLPDLTPLIVPLERLSHLPGNPRKGDIAAVAASLATFGQHKPIVVRRTGTDVDGNDVGIVLAGNHTLDGATELGWDGIAVVWTDDDELTAKARALADNRTAELGSYDDEALAAMLADVAVDPALLAATAFTDDDLARLLGTDKRQGLTDPDEFPEPPEDAFAKLGDVWLLGPHRVTCGDSTKAAVVERLMLDDVANLVWTDPPYGVDYVGKTKDALTIENDGALGLEGLLRGAFAQAMRSTHPGSPWYVSAPAGPQFLSFAIALTEIDVWRQTLVWVKDQFVMGRSDYHYRHEALFYGWTPGAAHRAPPNRTQDTVWEVARPRVSIEHPTMKPVALIERAIENSSDVGEIVLDLFGGSGSTLIAAETTCRIARMVELDPRYVDVICRRYQEFSGEKPVLEATGEVHDFTTE